MFADTRFGKGNEEYGGEEGSRMGWRQFSRQEGGAGRERWRWRKLRSPRQEGTGRLEVVERHDRDAGRRVGEWRARGAREGV